MDLIWTVISFALTLMILSYLFGDNPLFRIASYLFIGVSAGTVAVMLVQKVLWFDLLVPISQGNLLMVVPLVLGGMLLFKVSPRLAILGNLSTAYLVGIGAAVAIGGAVTGTIIGQSREAINSFDLARSSAPLLQLVAGFVMLVGTISTLIYFQFGAKVLPGQPPARPQWVEVIAGIGKYFIVITLGAIFAGVFSAALTALIGRIDSLAAIIQSFK